jgi:hypothetical protein
MGRRSDFQRVPKDLYRTWDPRALPPLLAHVPRGSSFIEPCAGHGDLVRQLVGAGMVCMGAFDLDPPPDVQVETRLGQALIGKGDATKFRLAKHYDPSVDFFVSNPPWTRDILHAIILNLYWQRPTWLIFDSAWAHTEQARPYLPLCRMIVSTPRLKWIENSTDNAKDDTAFYLFAPAGYPEMRGRI